MRLNGVSVLGRVSLAVLVVSMCSSCMLFTEYPLDELWQRDYSLSGLQLGFSYPPMGDAEERAFTLQHAQALNVSMFRLDAHWSENEPQEDQYNWSAMDDITAWASANNLQIFLTFKQDGPDWACGESGNHACVYARLDAFREYVALFLDRYAEHITWVQFGNEWPASNIYPGTAQQYVEAANIVHDEAKAHDPNLIVVLGGLSVGELRRMSYCAGYLDSYQNGWESGYITADRRNEVCAQADIVEVLDRTDYGIMNARYDMIDMHFYDDPENWGNIIDYMRSYVPDGQFIVTEFGGPNTNWHPYDENRHAYRMYDYVAALENAGIDRAFLFTLVQNPSAYHEKSGIITGGWFPRELPAYEVMVRFFGE